MAERKKQKTKRRDKTKDRGDEPTKEEYAIAKYVRFNCQSKSALIIGNDMNYFTGSKAVDSLMNSKWASDKAKNRLFVNRQSCVDFLQSLLEKSLLFRAKKLVRKRKDRPAGQNSAEGGAKDQQASGSSKISKNESGGVRKRKDSLEKSPKNAKKRDSVDESKENDDKATDDEDKEKKDKKKPKKVKFEIHPEQIFIDGANDIYVWKYDPTSTKTFLLGLGIVIGAIGVCLFPLWPPQVRLGVYYLSLVAMGFVGVIISLVVIRSVLFGAIWAGSWGKHHFWLLPNLTEDCGFFESFKPFYSHKVSDKSSGDKKSSSADKEKKAKDSDKEESSEDEKDKEEEEEEEIDIDKEESEDEEAARNGPTDTDRLSDEESEEENDK